MLADEPITTCARHPKVETGLRCASCGTYICPRCLVQTPVGAKCKTCASGATGGLFKPSPLQMSLAAAAGLVMGVIAGFGVEFNIGFFSLFLAFIYGGMAGEAVLRACGRRRGVKIEVITGIAMSLGALGARLLMAAVLLAAPGNIHPPHGILDVLVDLVKPSPVPLISLVIAISSAVSRIRYM